MKILVVEDQIFLKSAINDILFGIKNAEVIYCLNYREAELQLEKFQSSNSRFELVISDLQFANGCKIFRVLEMAKSYKIPCLVFSMCDSRIYIQEALKYEVQGFVSKMDPAEELENAVNEIIRGRTYFSKLIQTNLNESTDRLIPKKLILTKTETHLLHCFAEGLSFKQIVQKYGLNENTLRNHRRQMLFKNQCNFEQLIASYHAWPPEMPFCESTLLKTTEGIIKDTGN